MSATVPMSPAPGALAARRSTPRPPTTGPVLLAADGRAAAIGAVRVADAVAHRLGAPVEVLAVVEPFATYGAEMFVALPPELDADRREETHAGTRRQLAEILPGSAADAWRLDTVTGSPPFAIAEAADARGARLVVLGLGRHAPVDRIFGSETALGVLRRAGCPVLAVPADAPATLARAVAAVDFSAASVRAAETAADVLDEGGALTVLHVRPKTSALLSGGAAVLAAWEEAYTRRTGELLDRLTAMLRARRPDLQVTATVRTGAPAEETLLAASDLGADLVATGSQGTGAVERLLLGSVSTAIVRRATTAVLACREPEAPEAARIERALFGVTEETDRAAWAALLAEVTARNAGRRTRVEVDDPVLGARVAERGYAFLGAAYDRRDRRVELMFGDPTDRTQHLTRSLPHVESVQVEAGPGGRAAALRVYHGSGHTVVTFDD